MNEHTTWIAKIQHPGLQPYWIGNFLAADRTKAKVVARRFVAEHVPTDCKIICIAQGHIAVRLDGPEIPME